jgi:hypothetical protein
MGFSLAELFVEVKADTRNSDAGIKATEAKVRALPTLKVVGLDVDTRGFDAGIARARKDLAGYDLAGAGYALGPEPSRKAPAQAAPVLNNHGFASQVARAKADLLSLPERKVVRLDLSASAFSAGLASAKLKLGEAVTAMKASLASMATTYLPIAGLAAGAEAFRASVKGASDLAETMSKVEVVFGSASGYVKQFAEGMAADYGSARVELLDAAAGFGLIGKAAGLAQGDAADLAVTFAQLADDASSFYNVPLEDALLTIKSALVGESEPIRRFGVLLNEDAVKAEAFRLGIAKAGKEVSESGKVMARASLIQKGMADAQGDHARTAGSFANQLREFTGRLYDLGVTVGSIALPALNGFLAVLNPVARGIGFVADVLKKTTDLFGEFFAKAAQAAGLSSEIKTPTVGTALATDIQSGGGPTPAGPSGGIPRGIEAAKETVAKEKEHDDQKRLTDRVKLEQDAADKIKERERQTAAIYKQVWTEARAKAIEARLNASQKFIAASKEEIEYAKAYNAELARKAPQEAEKQFDPGRRPKDFDLQPQRAAIAKGFSLGKEVLGDALNFREALKQKALGVVARGIGAGNALGEPERRKREKEQEGRENFRAEFLNNEGLSQRIQSAALAGKDKGEQKEIAKNTGQAVQELKNQTQALKDLLKQGMRAFAAYG